MIVIARDSNCKSKTVPADPGCSGVPGFPYTQQFCASLEAEVSVLLHR